jgi:hypothetical protein
MEKNFGDLSGYYLANAFWHLGGQVRTTLTEQLQIEVGMSGNTLCQFMEPAYLWLIEHLRDGEIEVQCPVPAGHCECQ